VVVGDQGSLICGGTLKLTPCPSSSTLEYLPQRAGDPGSIPGVGTEDHWCERISLHVGKVPVRVGDGLRRRCSSKEERLGPNELVGGSNPFSGTAL
jgi:hypothetical protein